MEKITVLLKKIEALEVQPDSGLVKTVEEVGILQNVILREEKGEYKVVAGRRRIQAARQVGLKDISAVVVGDENKAIITLIENIHRSGNPAAEAIAMQELLDKKMTQEDIAGVLHIDRSQVSKRVKLLNLTPELFGRLEKGDLKLSIARELADLSKKDQAEFGRDSVTLKEAQKFKREKTSRTPEQVPFSSVPSELARALKPDADHETETVVPETPVETKGSGRGETILPDFDLSKKEKGVLKHAYTHGLLDPGNIKRKPMDEVAKDYNMKKTTYSMHLVNARRKIVSKVCERMLK